mgnify:CR=1 FL=1
MTERVGIFEEDIVNLALALVDPEQLGVFIRVAREQLGMSQLKLSKYSGVSQSYINKIENGQVEKPSYDTVYHLILGFYKFISEKRGKTRRARDIHSTDVCYVKRYTPVREALEKMRKNEYSQLPVIEDWPYVDSVVGVVTEKSLLRLLEMENVDLDKVKVEDVMEPLIPLVEEDTPIERVKELLKHHYAVLTYSGREVKGIITKWDLIHKL